MRKLRYMERPNALDTQRLMHVLQADSSAKTILGAPLRKRIETYEYKIRYKAMQVRDLRLNFKSLTLSLPLSSRPPC